MMRMIDPYGDLHAPLPLAMYPTDVSDHLRVGMSPPLPPVYEGRIWHNTTVQGALGLFESQVLWASQFDCMNDPSENSWGWRVIKDRYLQRKNEFTSRVQEQFDETFSYDMRQDWMRQIYIVSASLSENSLDQFRAYGQVSVEVPNGIWTQHSSERRYNPHWQRAVWRPLIYDPSEALVYIDAMLDCCAEIINGPEEWDFTDEGLTALTAMRSLALLIKHPAYKSETEVRLIIDLVPHAIRGEHTRKVAVPGDATTPETHVEIEYIEVRPEFDLDGKEPAPILVQSVLLGPVFAFDESIPNLTAHAQALLPKVPPMSVSDIPYRERGQQPFPPLTP